MKDVNSSMIYFLHCKNFCKFHNVPPPSTTIKEKEKMGEQAQLLISDFNKYSGYLTGKTSG
jgi:hypothetical protein